MLFMFGVGVALGGCLGVAIMVLADRKDRLASADYDEDWSPARRDAEAAAFIAALEN